MYIYVYTCGSKPSLPLSLYIFMYIYGAQNLSASGRNAFTRHQRSGRESDSLQERHPPGFGVGVQGLSLFERVKGFMGRGLEFSDSGVGVRGSGVWILVVAWSLPTQQTTNYFVSMWIIHRLFGRQCRGYWGIPTDKASESLRLAYPLFYFSHTF